MRSRINDIRFQRYSDDTFAGLQTSFEAFRVANPNVEFIQIEIEPVNNVVSNSSSYITSTGINAATLAATVTAINDWGTANPNRVVVNRTTLYNGATYDTIISHQAVTSYGTAYYSMFIVYLVNS